MRMFHHAGALSLASLLIAAITFGPAANAAKSGPAAGQRDIGAKAPPAAPSQNPSRRLAELRATLDHRDRLTALRALHMALSQVPDGGTFLWQKKSRSLKGVIKPDRAFRNADGQVCRHVVYALALGRFIKQIEGIACREEDGAWRL